MTDFLFHKAVVFTDIHYGRGGNSSVFNKDADEFLEWAVDRALSWGAETCIFCGDMFDNRSQIGVVTLNHALQSLERLNRSFLKVYSLVGNHDCPFREKRVSSSLELGRNFENIQIVRDPLTLNGVTFLPWLVGDEVKTIKALKSRYVFGHLEMGGFMMNAKVIIPDAPTLIKPDQFIHQEFVFSGHFHQRQTAKFKDANIVYIGNSMPFNFSDNWDDDRGIMLLEWGKEPVFETWAEQPVYRTTTFSKLMENPSAILRPKATIRATLDTTLHYEEIQEIREALQSEYGVRKFEIIAPGNESEDDQDFKEQVVYKSVDQMVIDGIMSVESDVISPERLINIYRGLTE